MTDRYGHIGRGTKEVFFENGEKRCKCVGKVENCMENVNFKGLQCKVLERNVK